jgi:hypothetical protein
VTCRPGGQLFDYATAQGMLARRRAGCPFVWPDVRVGDALGDCMHMHGVISLLPSKPKEHRPKCLHALSKQDGERDAREVLVQTGVLSD